MANRKHVDLIKKSVEDWNEWRKEDPKERVDFDEADLRGADLRGADLREADLVRASLDGANLKGADLRGADFSQADLFKVDLRKANIREANLFEANLSDTNLLGAILVGANLSRAELREASLICVNLTEGDLSDANLMDACLMGAILIEANLKGADLTGCIIYGISAWNVKLDKHTVQTDLVITKQEEPIITVDNLEVAQFIYLLLKNEKIRNVIDTITTKVVLILGRFTPKRKVILDAIREELRKHNYIPVLFDFEKPAGKNIQETVITLANLAKFIIADITSPKSIPQELTSIVPNNPSLPVKPIIKKGSKPWGMFGHIQKYNWVLDVYKYKDLGELISSLEREVIIPAEAKVKEVRKSER